MGSDKFGVQLQELAKIQQDWHCVSERMAEMSQNLGKIKSTLEKAAATDLLASPLAGIAGFGIALDVAKDVKDIEARAAQLLETKKKLTEEIAQDAQKIKAVIAEYEAADRKIAEELEKQKHEHDKPKSPGHGGSSTGLDSSGKGGGGGGGGHHEQPKSPGHGGDSSGGGGDTSGNDGSGITSHPGGKHDGPKLKDRSEGDWKTQHGDSWDSWSDHRHKRNGEGEGPVAQPKLDGVSDERKAMVERAMERVNRKLGYSQVAVTNGYRVDCSGFLSCAWGMPGPGTTTGPLISESSGLAHHISKSSMEPGDALVVHHTSGDQEQHVVLFGGWADAGHTQMIILEDNGKRGCVSREVSLSAYAEYTAIRKNGM